MDPHPESLDHLRAAAAAAMADGRFAEAIELSKARARKAPRDPGPLADLGACLFAARRPEAALRAYASALALAPGHPGLVCAQARVLQSLSRTAEADALYRQALVTDPTMFEAAFGLALLALEAGDWDRVTALITTMAAEHGARADLEWLTARAEIGGGRCGAALERILRLLAQSSLAPAQRADLMLLQGDALDGLGRAADAFAAAVRGKQIQRQLYAERAAGREGQIDKLTRLARWFEAADPEPWRQSPAEAPVPDQAGEHAFILGFPRSGTTLLELALAGHPHVATLEEAPTLAEAYAEFLASDAGLKRLAGLDADAAQLWRARYWAEVRAQGADVGGRLFIDKAPAETLSLPLIAKLFPRAKVLFALRDPRDVVLSCVRQNFQLNAMTWTFTDLGETAACYDACMALAQTYRRILPLELMAVRHEELVEAFPAEIARIAGWLGLEPHPSAMIDPAEIARARTVRTPSADQVRAGLNGRGLGRWQALRAELEPMMPMIGPWVQRLGYDLA